MKRQKFKMQVRHWTALVSGFIYNLNVFGLSARGICSPGFNCHGCKWATFACPVGIVGYGFGIRQIPAFALGTLIAIGLVFGRLVCAYACPVGLAQEALYRIPSPKPRLPKFLRYVKYLVLFLLVFGLTWFFGFQPTKGFIKVHKPEINKITGDETAAADEGHDKNYCPVPDGLIKNGAKKMPGLINRINTIPPAGGTSATPFKIKPIGGTQTAPAQKPATINAEEKASSVKPAQPANPFQSLKPPGLSSPSDASRFKLKGTKPIGGSAASTNNPITQSFPGATKPAAKAGKPKLSVTLTIENVSSLPVEGFTYTATYYSNRDKSILWQDKEPRVCTNTVAPGESLTLPAFVIPYMIDKAELVITSPQSNVELDYWPLFCTYCPVAVVEADLPGKISKSESWSQMFYDTTRMNLPRLLIALAVFVLCIMISRFFCRVLCPLGAVYALLSKFSIYRIEVHHEKCVSCSMIAGSNACTRCDADCPVGLDVFTEAGSAECIACGNCLSACPKGAIVSKFKI